MPAVPLTTLTLTVHVPDAYVGCVTDATGAVAADVALPGVVVTLSPTGSTRLLTIQGTNADAVQVAAVVSRVRRAREPSDIAKRVRWAFPYLV